jgi:hypothetical protein
MTNLQALPNYPYHESIQFLVLIPIYLSSIILFSHLRLGFPKGLFPVGLPVKILKALLPYSIVLHALPILIFI